jgi:transketolase
VASRKPSQQMLGRLTPMMPETLGGSADPTGSNLTDFSGFGAVSGGRKGRRHINCGVRCFSMVAIMNGSAPRGGFIPYGDNFLRFSDYSRNTVRMAAWPHGRMAAWPHG